MKWAARAKNAVPANAKGLRASMASIEEETRALSAEGAAIEEVLPKLVGSPAEFREAESRLYEIQSLLPSKHRTIAMIGAEIEKADERERRTDILVECDELDRRTAKLAKDLAQRYDKAAHALASILAELDENQHAWSIMNDRLRELGERNGETAERRVRRVADEPSKQWSMGGVDISLILHSSIISWDERVLFSGKGVKRK